MKTIRLKSPNKYPGFTIVETMIVLAIAGLIMVIVFVTVRQAQVSVRDNHRKAYAKDVLGAMEQYYKNNGKFPGCLSPGNPPGCTDDDMKRFLTNYLPEGKDPSTGTAYASSSTIDLANGVSTDTGAAIYYYNSIEHNTMPPVGGMYIATAHWCYSSHPDTDVGPPLAGTGADNNLSVFSVVVYQEHGEYYCLDNYASSGEP